MNTYMRTGKLLFILFVIMAYIAVSLAARLPLNWIFQFIPIVGITLAQAKGLTHGKTLYHVHNRNADGTPQRWRVNGMVKTWKRNPARVSVPIKHGLYSYDYLTEDELELVCLDEQEALNYAKDREDAHDPARIQELTHIEDPDLYTHARTCDCPNCTGQPPENN